MPSARGSCTCVPRVEGGSLRLEPRPSPGPVQASLAPPGCPDSVGPQPPLMAGGEDGRPHKALYDVSTQRWHISPLTESILSPTRTPASYLGGVE